MNLICIPGERLKISSDLIIASSSGHQVIRETTMAEQPVAILKNVSMQPINL